MNKFFQAAAFAIAIGSATLTAPAFAQDPTDPKMESSKMQGDKMGKMAGGKMQDKKMGKMDGDKKMSKEVYVCKECKTYFSAAAAKKMMNKDPMGHMLKKMKSAPKGYMDGEKMKGKM